MQRGQNLSNAWQEPVKEVDTAQVSLQLHLGHRLRHGGDGLHLGGEGNDARAVHRVTKVCDGRHGQDALVAVQGEAGDGQTTKNLPEIGFVGGNVRAGDKNIVKIDENPGLGAKHAVNEPLKCLGGVFEPKRHPQKLKQSKRCDNCRFLDVFSRHWDLVIAPD